MLVVRECDEKKGSSAFEIVKQTATQRSTALDGGVEREDRIGKCPGSECVGGVHPPAECVDIKCGRSCIEAKPGETKERKEKKTRDTVARRDHLT